MFFNRGVCVPFRILPTSLPSNMSLNPFAPEWQPGMLYNAKIAAIVRRANDPAVWAPTMAFAGWGLPKQPIFDLTYEEALAAAKLHPGVIQMLPDEHRTYELCYTGLSSASHQVIENYNCNGENFPLLHVPLEHRDEAMCLAGAAWSNRALWYWPKEMRTKAMYIKAAKLNPSTLKTMETPLCRDPEVVQAAAETLAKSKGCSLEAAKAEVEVSRYY